MAKAATPKTPAKTPKKPTATKPRDSRAKQIAMNSHIENPMSGMGGWQDRATGATNVWWKGTNPFIHGFNTAHMARTAYDLFYSDWAAHKIISIPVDDMFREGIDFKYHGQDTGVDKRLEDECERLDLIRQLIRGKKMERLLGGAVGIMILRGHEGEKAETAVRPEDVDKDKGDLIDIHIIGRNLVTRVEWETDPLKEGYNRPAHYWINGQKTHRSRLIVFDGNPLSPHPERDFYAMPGFMDGFGVSVLSPIWNALNRAELAQQGASHLIQMASVWFATYSGLRDLKASKQGQEAVEELRYILETMSMYKAVLLDGGEGGEVDVKCLGSNFGGVPEMVMQYLQILSAGSDIPATRFLGQAPGGLNATGESDLENYYDSIRAKQKNEINPIFRRQILPVLLNSTFGTGVIDPADITIEWPGLWNLSDTEKAQVETLHTNNITTMFDTFNLPVEWAIDELARRDVIANKPNLKERDEKERERIRDEIRLMREGQPVNGEGAASTGDARIPGLKTGLPRMPGTGVSVGGGLPRLNA